MPRKGLPERQASTNMTTNGLASLSCHPSVPSVAAALPVPLALAQGGYAAAELRANPGELNRGSRPERPTTTSGPGSTTTFRQASTRRR
jgi:hypothetical protein